MQSSTFLRYLSKELFYLQRKCFSASTQPKTDHFSKNSKIIHCYKRLYPWTNVAEFSEHLASTIVYNKDGLIALNKPFGIQIYSQDKSDTRPKKNQRIVVSPIPDCDLAIEDALEHLKHHLNVPNLSIMKSAEKYSSGIVLLSTNKKTSDSVRRSFNIAKSQRRTPHLTHWLITLGYPVVTFREEKVALKFMEDENESRRKPVIVTDFGKNEVKQKRVHPVNVVYRTLSTNTNLQTSLVEISTSSVNWYFVRVYASSRIASILGDPMYSNRMNTFLGMPVKLHIEQALAFDMPPISENMAKVLNIPKGVNGHSIIPSMLHLRSILLPSFYGTDLTITAKPPTHFQWTAEQFELLSSCI